MAQEIQSREGLFDAMFDSLRNHLGTNDSSLISLGIIHAIADETREDKAKLRITIEGVSKGLAQLAEKLKK